MRTGFPRRRWLLAPCHGREVLAAEERQPGQWPGAAWVERRGRLVRRGGEWTGSRIIDQCGTRLAGARADAFTRRSPTTGDARPLEDLIEW